MNGAVSQSYDDDFRVASQTVAGSTTEAFLYDDDGLLTAAGPMTLGRDPLNGLLTSTTVGSVATSQGYNGFGELASDAAQVGASTAYANTYTRDALGRITQKTETIQGVTTTFTYHYDPAGRLEQVDEDGAPARTYTYDANGNRLSLTDHTQGGQVTSGSYDAQDRLETYGSFTYIYNANGDLTSKTDTATGETTTYAYDALGNLVQVDLPDGRTITYVIDGQNRRIGKKVDGTLVKAWLYQDQLSPVAELDGSGNVVARFVYGSRPNVPDLMVKGGQTYRIVSDHLGSPRLVVNAATGAVAQRLDYDEWGVVDQDTPPGFQPFGFAGGIYDADTGLVRFGARDYDPEVGRWAAKDPIRFSSKSRNLYAYTLGDPINLVDSSGHDYRPPPANGRVKNESEVTVFAKTDFDGYVPVPPGESTDFLDDADFVYVPQTGQTWKVGPNGLSIQPDGSVRWHGLGNFDPVIPDCLPGGEQFKPPSPEPGETPGFLGWLGDLGAFSSVD